MKALVAALSLVFALLPGGRACAQDTLRLYLNRDKLPIAGPDSAAYTRKAWKDGEIWRVRDCCYPEGTLWLEGSYLDSNFKTATGLFVYYAPSGRHSCEGHFINGRPDGSWTGWFSSGRLSYETHYLKGVLHGTNTWRHSNGQVSEESDYERGELLQSRFWSADGTPMPNGTSAGRPAVFKGGEADLYRYVRENIRYPKKARRKGDQGKAFVQFTIGTDGTVGGAKVVQSTGSRELDEEALRVIRSMPPWTPGLDHNRQSGSVFKLPIEFRLD